MTDAWAGNGESSTPHRGSSDDPASQFLRPFSRVGAERAQAILNVLVESSFFYQQDDPDLFATLRRHARVFQTFFEATFGWDLMIDPFVAKLNKPSRLIRASRGLPVRVREVRRRGDIHSATRVAPKVPRGLAILDRPGAANASESAAAYGSSDRCSRR
jgi:hypothetical protein